MDIEQMVADLDRVTLETEPKCTPLAEWVMVRKEAEKKLTSGIITPDVTAQARAAYFVVKVGPDVTRVKGGEEVVLTPETWAIPCTQDTRRYFLVKEENICAILG